MRRLTGQACPGFSDQEFAEPVALSSTPPADVPLGVSRRIHSTYSRPVRLQPSRVPCSAQDSHYNGQASGTDPREGIVRNLR